MPPSETRRTPAGVGRGSVAVDPLKADNSEFSAKSPPGATVGWWKAHGPAPRERRSEELRHEHSATIRDAAIASRASRAGDLAERLAAECAGRDLSPAARAELDRLIREGDPAELERVLRDLPPIVVQVDADPATTDAFVVAWADHEHRVEAHRHRIAAEAFRLGEAVSAHKVTVADAERRLGALLDTLDPEAPIVVALDPHPAAHAIARAAFARGADHGA